MVNTMIFVLGMAAGAAVYWVVDAVIRHASGADCTYDEHADIDGNGWGEK